MATAGNDSTHWDDRMMWRDARTDATRRAGDTIGFIGLAFAVLLVPASLALGQAAPAELPDRPAAGIIVPVENDPAAAQEEAQQEPKPASQPGERDADASLSPKLLSEEIGNAKELPQRDAHHPATFQGVVPGSTNREQLISLLGEPETEAADEHEPDTKVLTYHVGPFPRVDVTLEKELVQSILIHLETPGTRRQVRKELNLSRFVPVAIVDGEGQPLGEVYPERGLTLVFASGAEEPGQEQVGNVLLEQISAEPFLLRARENADLRLSQCLSDIQTVHQLLPEQSESYGLEAEIHQRAGDLEAALEAARTAVRLDPDTVSYRLTVADLQRQRGQFDDALQQTQEVLQAEDLAAPDEALARLQLAKVLATMPPRDYKQAMGETVKAIQLAAALKKEADEPASLQRAGILLIDAELWLARIIAHGPWNTRREVAPQWLASAEQTARELIQEDVLSEWQLLRVYCASLECLDVLGGKGDPARLADAAITLGRQLIGHTDDTQAQAAIEDLLGTALRRAAEVASQQGKPADALRYANNANALLTSALGHRPRSAETEFELARVQFLIGSVYALHEQDHHTAVEWYTKSLPKMVQDPPPALREERGRQGDQLISIGVSMWQVGRKKLALRATEKGAQLLEDAINSGTVAERVLAVPMANLAEMHRAFGNQEQAKQYARLAARLEAETGSAKPKKRR